MRTNPYDKQVRREFVLEVDVAHGSDIWRETTVVTLSVFPNRPDTDPNKWTVSIGGGALGINWSASERKAHELFCDEVRKLWAKERAAKAEGRFGESRWTVGSFVADG